MKKRELVVAPLCEALLLFVAGAVGWLTHTPLLFASLGPTAFEMIEMPHRPSARPYNVVVGHLLAVVAGFASLHVTGAWTAPPVTAAVTLPRLEAAVLASALTVVATVLCKARQPAALSTALLITLGALQTHADAFYIMAGTVLVTLAGEPLRRWRAATVAPQPS